MATTVDSIKSYKRILPPTIPGSERRYLDDQLKAIETAFTSVVEVLKLLEARIRALEPP